MIQKGVVPVLVIVVIFLLLAFIVGFFVIERRPDLLNSDLKELRKDPINTTIYPNSQLVATVEGATEHTITEGISGAYIEKVFVSQESQEMIYSLYKEIAIKSGVKPEGNYEEEFTLPCFAGDRTILEKMYGNPEKRGCSGNFINLSPKKYFKLSFPKKVYPQRITYRMEFISHQKPYISNIRFFDKTNINDFDFSFYKTAYILRLHMHY